MAAVGLARRTGDDETGPVTGRDAPLAELALGAPMRRLVASREEEAAGNLKPQISEQRKRWLDDMARAGWSGEGPLVSGVHMWTRALGR